MLLIAGVDDNPRLVVFLDGRVHLDGHSLLCELLPDGSLLNLPCGSLLDGSLPSRLCWGILLDDCRRRVSILLFVFLIIAAVNLFLGTLLPYLLLDDTPILKFCLTLIDFRLHASVSVCCRASMCVGTCVCACACL